MELNLSTAYRVFDHGVKRVAKSLLLSEPYSPSVEPQIQSYVTQRAFIIFKLDLLLFQHRNKHDKERFVLFGKNALYHYLFTKKNIPVEEAKKMDFHDVLLTVWDELAEFQIPKDVDDYLHKNFYFNNPDPQSISPSLRSFDNSEWDPDFSDRRLNQ